MSYKPFLFTLTLTFLSLESCFWQKDELPKQALTPIWSYDFPGINMTIGITPEVHGDIVLYSHKKSQDITANDVLVGLDKSSGQVLWTWTDFFSNTFQSFSGESLKPVWNNQIAITIGGRNFCIDLSNGKTVWKNRSNGYTSRSDLSHLDHILFRTDISDLEKHGELRESIMKADFQTGQWEKIFSISGGDSIRQGLQVPSFYFEPDGDTILIFTNTLHHYEKRVIIPRLLSYNMSKRVLNYDTLLDEPSIGNAVDWFPIVDGNRVYISVDDMMVCHNVQTAERIWKRQLNANILSSNFILVDGRIYSQTEGFDPTLWCLDAETGSVIWKIASYGFSSLLNYYNGQIIYVGGGGFLRYVDAYTGEVLAEILAPSSFKNDNDFFSGRCKVDPNTGYVYTVSQSTAYCYPPLEK